MKTMLDNVMLHIVLPFFMMAFVWIAMPLCGKKKNPPQPKAPEKKPPQPPSSLPPSTSAPKRLGTTPSKASGPVKPKPVASKTKTTEKKSEDFKPKEPPKEELLLPPPLSPLANLPPPPPVQPQPSDNDAPIEPPAPPNPPPIVIEDNECLCFDAAPPEMRKFVDEITSF